MRSINEVRPKSGWLVAVAMLVMADPAIGQDWSRQFVSAARFQLLEDFDYEAALDRETRLVWEIQPLSSTTGWQGARNHCLGKEVGGRLGWRLPTIEELASLVDPDELAPALPAGHPFLGGSQRALLVCDELLREPVLRACCQLRARRGLLLAEGRHGLGAVRARRIGLRRLTPEAPAYRDSVEATAAQSTRHSLSVTSNSSWESKNVL